MRYTPSQDPARHLDSTATHSLGYVLVTSILGAIGVIAIVMAVLYPITAVGAVALAGAGLLATRQLRRFYRTRRRTGRTRTVCVPRIGICVTL